MVNGLYAAFVVWYYMDDPAGAPPCAAESGGSGSSALAVRLVNDYATFFGLVTANFLAMGVGVAWYVRVGRGWLSDDDSRSAYPDLAPINSGDTAKEVDYLVVKARLDAAKRLLKEDTSETVFVFDVCTYEEKSGQNLERVTLDMVLKTEALTAPHGVWLLEISVSEKSSLVVLDTFAKMQGKPPSWKSCWLCWEEKYGVERSWKTCWRAETRKMARVDVAMSNFSSAASVEALSAPELKELWWYEQCADVVEKAKTLAAVTQEGIALRYASAEMQNERDVVLTAVKQNGIALDYASGEMKNDRDVVLAAVKQKCSALKFAMKADPELLRVARAHPRFPYLDY